MTAAETFRATSDAKFPSTWHCLKIDPIPMDDLLSGKKRAEVRKDDRGFKAGDGLSLTCSDGRAAELVITHIQRGYGLPDDIAVLSVVRLDGDSQDMADIFRRVAGAHGLTLGDMRGHSHRPNISQPRQSGMLACRRAGHTFASIGWFLGRDHTTIITGVKAARAREEREVR